MAPRHFASRDTSKIMRGELPFQIVLSATWSFSVYVALTNIPVGELLTGFAMRSDPNVVFG